MNSVELNAQSALSLVGAMIRDNPDNPRLKELRDWILSVEGAFTNAAKALDRVSEFEEVIESLESDVSSLEDERTDLENKVDDLEDKVIDLEDELDELKGEMEEKDFTNLEDNYKVALNRLAEAKEHIRLLVNPDMINTEIPLAKRAGWIQSARNFIENL